MKKWFARNHQKRKKDEAFTHFLPSVMAVFKKPRPLWVGFSLRLSLVLCLATIIPILLLYVLSRAELIEASYRIDTNELSQAAPDLNQEWPVPPDVPIVEPSSTNEWPRVNFDPDLGLWRLSYDMDVSKVIFISPIFNFHIEMPAWIAIGTLPLFSLFVGVLLSIWMSRSVTWPISQLAEAAHAIGRRDLGYRVQTEGSQELRDLAQSFNRMAEELEHAEITRRNLMADVAHELRTPLAVLDGNLRAILDGVHALNEEEIALLYEQTHHLNHLVDDLRELSLAEAGQLSLDLQEVDLTHLVRETAAHFDLVAQDQGIQLTTELDELLAHSSLDQNRIRQVLHNLLSNAFCHTPPGGQVAISAKRLSDNNALQITVADTGAGISLEELPYIFDRFYRTERTASRDRDGTGLGLAIVKAIVEAHGGRVSAASAGRNLGSAFSIVFPEAGSIIQK